MKKEKMPFFAKFLESQKKAVRQATIIGGTTKPSLDNLQTDKYPSDDDEFQTDKYPSDYDEYQTDKYPSDHEDSQTDKYPSDWDDGIIAPAY
jgi:Serine endopeptidase inhibitors